MESFQAFFTAEQSAQPEAAPEVGRKPSPAGKAAQSTLKRVLDTGALGEIVEQLCAMATPPAHSLDDLQQRLDDPQQREALALLQRARWAGGDPVAARAALRTAFKRGPRWHVPAKVGDAPLPPLYPPA